MHGSLSEFMAKKREYVYVYVLLMMHVLLLLPVKFSMELGGCILEVGGCMCL